MARSRYTVIFEAVRPDRAPELPRRATRGSACFDLAAAAAVQLRRNRVEKVPTGWRARSPPGTFLEVRPRSGLASRGVVMVNGPGTIDRDYSGEILVPLTYLLPGTYPISAGDRIAQIRLVPELATDFRLGRVAPVPGRAGGFGSTGR